MGGELFVCKDFDEIVDFVIKYMCFGVFYIIMNGFFIDCVFEFCEKKWKINFYVLVLIDGIEECYNYIWGSNFVW